MFRMRLTVNKFTIEAKVVGRDPAIWFEFSSRSFIAVMYPRAAGNDPFRRL